MFHSYWLDGVSQHCFLHKLLILQLPSDGHSLVSWNFAQGIHSLPSTEMRKYIFKKDFIYLLLERREGKEKERERNMDVQEIYRLVASPTPPTGDLVCNPGMCPDWESNWWPFSLQASIQSTEPQQPGLKYFFMLVSAFWDTALQFCVTSASQISDFCPLNLGRLPHAARDFPSCTRSRMWF